MKFGTTLLRVLVVAVMAFVFTYFVANHLGRDSVLAETSWEKISDGTFAASGDVVTHSLATDTGIYFALRSSGGVKVWVY